MSPSIEREILLDTLENDFGVVGDAQKWLAWPLIYLMKAKTSNKEWHTRSIQSWVRSTTGKLSGTAPVLNIRCWSI